MKVLIVEDEVRIREGLGKLLSRSGGAYEVIGEEGNGANGLTFRQTSDIHLSDVDFTPIGGFIINFGDPQLVYNYGTK